MGHSFGWLKNTENLEPERKAPSKTGVELDKEKIDKFKEKVQELKTNSSLDDSEAVKILRDALSVLNITEEPIEKFFKMGKVIGSGKFGLVREAYSRRKEDFKVAIKTINLQGVNSKYHIIWQEILTLKRVDHPNIVKLHEIYN